MFWAQFDIRICFFHAKKSKKNIMKFKPKSRLLAWKILLFRMKYAISGLTASFLAFVNIFAKKYPKITWIFYSGKSWAEKLKTCCLKGLAFTYLFLSFRKYVKLQNQCSQVKVPKFVMTNKMGLPAASIELNLAAKPFLPPE